MRVELIVRTPDEELAIPYLPEDASILALEARWFAADIWRASVHLEIDGIRTPLPWTPPHP